MRVGRKSPKADEYCAAPRAVVCKHVNGRRPGAIACNPKILNKCSQRQCKNESIADCANAIEDLIDR